MIADARVNEANVPFLFRLKLHKSRRSAWFDLHNRIREPASGGTGDTDQSSNRFV